MKKGEKFLHHTKKHIAVLVKHMRAEYPHLMHEGMSKHDYKIIARQLLLLHSMVERAEDHMHNAKKHDEH